MKIKRYLYWLLSVFPMLVNAQTAEVTRNEKFAQSPNAAGLGIYGVTDISPFTGLPDVSIPVFSARQGVINISADLKYFGGGVKPEDHPGWVGQNWTLNVGGVVTRKKNGEIDELYTAEATDKTLNSYLYKYGKLGGGQNTFSWDTKAYIDSLFDPEQEQQRGYIPVLSPDEFFFTLPNGKSGSFLKNHSGNWQVKCNQPGRIVVSVTTTDGFVLQNPAFPGKSATIPRIINKITMTDDDGTIYVFGNDANAIEFIRGPKTITADNSNIEANAWNLTKITSPTNDVVNFVYDRGEHQFVQNVGYGSTLSYNIGSCYGTSTIGNLQYTGQVITPSYLKEVNSASFKAVFIRSESFELQYPYEASTRRGQAFDNFAYPDFSKGNYGDGVNTDGGKLLTANPPKWFKLTGIALYNSKNDLKQSYFFGYNDDDISFSRGASASETNSTTTTAKRLFLLSFSKSPDYSAEPLPQQNYAFEYDQPDSLAGYNSLMVDQWGYYNHLPYPKVGQYNKSDLDAKYVANATYAKMGSLKKIIYPTGGWSEFTYELNDYASFLKRNLNGVSIISSQGQGGGLRIRKVVNYADANNFTSKEYFYTSSQSPGTSSGILAGWKQLYLKSKIGSNVKGYIESVSNNSINDLNYTNGRDVVYSEVKEKLQDGSYNIYKYTNSNQAGYIDESPTYIYGAGYGLGNTPYGSAYFSFDPAYDYPFSAHTSRETERGQLLSKETYTAGNTLIYKQANQYRDDANRFAEYVRNYNYTQQKVTCALSGGYMIERYREPTKIYTYFPFLKSRTETTYDLNGNNPAFTTTSYSYDTDYRLLKEEILTNSKGEALKTAYTYPVDFTTEVYPAMKAKNIISPVLEKTTSLNGVQTNILVNNYYQPFPATLPDLYAVSSVQGFNTRDTLTKFHDYDPVNGNLLSFSKASGSRTTYVWSYKRQYPVAKIDNADYATVVAVLGGATAVDNFAAGIPSDPQTFLAPLRTDARLKLAQVSTYSFEPMVGMTRSIDPKGRSTYYEYDGFQRLVNIKDQEGNIIKHTDYHYQGQ